MVNALENEVSVFMGFRRFFPVGKQIGDTVLFFGCRKKNEDYIYEDELSSYSQDGTLAQLHVAFSRDQVGAVCVYIMWIRIDKRNPSCLISSSKHIVWTVTSLSSDWYIRDFKQIATTTSTTSVVDAESGGECVTVARQIST